MLKDNGVTFTEYSDLVTNALPAKVPANAGTARVDKPYTKRWYAKAWRDGAALIERYGFRQGSFGSKADGFCAVGALSAALALPPTALTAVASRAAVGAAITGDSGMYTVLFNDTPGRTKGEVCRFMRAVAYTLEHGGTFPKWVRRIVEAREAKAQADADYAHTNGGFTTVGT